MKEIKAYQCDYCNYTNVNEQKVADHERNCRHNFTVPTCYNCAKSKETSYSGKFFCNDDIHTHIVSSTASKFVSNTKITRLQRNCSQHVYNDETLQKLVEYLVSLEVYKYVSGKWYDSILMSKKRLVSDISKHVKATEEQIDHCLENIKDGGIYDICEWKYMFSHRSLNRDLIFNRLGSHGITHTS